MNGRRRVAVDGFGGPEVMKVKADEVPNPGSGEARVRVQAAGVAYSDVLMRAGRYPGGPKPPFVPGWDVAGVVEEPGPGVPERWRGQRVVALVLAGGYASHLCVPVDDLVALPDSVDLLEAACLSLNYVTAFQMLHHVAEVRAGNRLLVHGAAGGVGTALLDLADRAGAQTHGTASSHKRDIVTSFGARFIDYRTEDFVARARDDSGHGMDVVFDPIGGANLRRSFQALRAGGRLVSYGFSAVASSRHPVVPVIRQLGELRARSLLSHGKRATFYRLSTNVRRHPERVREDLAMLVRELESGHVRPLIADVMPLDKVAHAHQLLADARVRGKILLAP